jgi:hypothetical protein
LIRGSRRGLSGCWLPIDRKLENARASTQSNRFGNWSEVCVFDTLVDIPLGQEAYHHRQHGAE